MYYILGHESTMVQYKTLAAGSGVLNLNKEIVKTVMIYGPKDKKEQQAIASILNDMDDQIAALQTKLSKYKQLKIAMMQQLLTGKLRLI